MNCLILPNVFNFVLSQFLFSFAIYLGAGPVQAIINAIPKVIIDGLAVGGGMIGAVGLALLLKCINVKAYRYYFLIGFFFSAF